MKGFRLSPLEYLVVCAVSVILGLFLMSTLSEVILP